MTLYSQEIQCLALSPEISTLHCIHCIWLTRKTVWIRVAKKYCWKQKRLLNLKCVPKYIQWEYEIVWYTVWGIRLFSTHKSLQHKTSVPDALQADTDMGDFISRGKVTSTVTFIEETHLPWTNPVDTLAKHWWERTCYSFLCSLVLKCFQVNLPSLLHLMLPTFIRKIVSCF